MNVIQVGIGGMGGAWLRAVSASPEVEFAGFVEVNAEIARTQSEKFGLDPSLIYPSLDQALSAVQADFVICVTPPQFHCDVSITAMDAGLPVLSEKPLADTLEAARDIVRKSNETGLMHVVSQNYRYRSPVQTLKRVLEEKRLGVISSVAVSFFRGSYFEGFRAIMPYPLVTDMAIHHFDLMRFFLDADLVSVVGRSWNPAWSWSQGDNAASLLLEFSGNLTVSYNGCWCSKGGETPWNAHWRFDCEKGEVALENEEVYIRANGGHEEIVPLVGMELENQPYVLHQFCEALQTRRAPRTVCQDNIKSLVIVFDIINSFTSGRVVRRTVGDET
jgi:predicted dehydrogenase